MPSYKSSSFGNITQAVSAYSSVLLYYLEKGSNLLSLFKQ